MPITPQNIIRHELIGLKVKIIKSTNPFQQGLEGTVTDERYNILKIKTNKGEKIISKKTSIFKFTLPKGKNVEVDGKLLVGRPEDRIKKKLPRW